MQAFASYIMRGRLQAILVAAAAAMLSLLLPPLTYISSAVIALVTLRRGATEGLVIIAGAALAMMAFAMVTPVHPAQAGMMAAAVWLPVWMLALVLRQTVSLSATLGIAAAMGSVVVIAVYLGVDNPAQVWRDLLEHLIEQAQQQGELAGADVLSKLLMDAAPRMTGMLLAALTLGLTLSVFLGRWWQALLYNPGGFGREFYGLRLGRHFAVVTLVALLVSLTGSDWLSEMAANVLIVTVAAYLVHGLGLIHGFVAAKGLNVGWLLGMYGLTLLLPQTSLLLAAAAFADSWLDIRTRMGKGKNGV